ncbi:hypothetical protein CFOL_v3_05326 [Cephalotus follicularis]|uniref:Uncharacterized protein n=1 Tax=Cephalotus follicularis TaxID=3775 RepID=A0A1Q3B1H1_CEPFO|nr:hypothetical protein CFOL_v3_05326 [Cephalotus follicularis]
MHLVSFNFLNGHCLTVGCKYAFIYVGANIDYNCIKQTRKPEAISTAAIFSSNRYTIPVEMQYSQPCKLKALSTFFLSFSNMSIQLFVHQSLVIVPCLLISYNSS